MFILMNMEIGKAKLHLAEGFLHSTPLVRGKRKEGMGRGGGGVERWEGN